MRILVIHNQYLEAGGEDQVVLAEMEMLKKNNISVEVVYYKNPKGTVNQLFGLLQSSFNIGSFFSLLKKIDEFKPDIVHLHNWHYIASPSIVWGAVWKKVPLIMTIHNYRLICPSATLFLNNKLYLGSLNSFGLLRSIKNKVYKDSYVATGFLALALFFNRKIGTWQRVKGFIFLNKFMENLHLEALELPRGRCFIKANFIQGGVLEQKFTQSVRSGFLFVGRLSKEKGISILLKAFQQSGYPLTIIGDGPLKYEVEMYSSLYPNIVYVGFKKRPDILDYMSSHRWLVFPSIWYEGMPITILESLMMGTPIIASNIGSLPYVVSENISGLLFDPGDVESLKEVLQKANAMLGGEFRNFCFNARRSYEIQYNEDVNYSSLLDVYQTTRKPL